MKVLSAFAFVAGLVLVSHTGASETIRSTVSAAAESSHVFCDATGSATVIKVPCSLRRLYVTTGASAGYLMLFNAIAAPANGAVTPASCIAVAATSTALIDLGDRSEPYVTGLTAAFSTTGCFTLTLSATAYFKGWIQ